jgi:hypothetical protein
MTALRVPVKADVVFASSLMEPGEIFDKHRGLQEWCRQTGCDTYLTGPGGTGYLDPDDWQKQSLKLSVHEPRPVCYDQQYAGWVPGLSALDVLLCVDDPRSIILSSTRREIC